MERDTNQMSQNVALCRSGCGFYGSPGTDGLCSKCYKDALKRKQSTQPTPGRTTPTASSGKSLEQKTMRESFQSMTLASCTSNACNTESLNSSSLSNEEVLSMSAASSVVPTATASLPDLKSKEEPIDAPEGATADKEQSQLDEPSCAAAADDDSQPKTQKKKKNRCNICRRKVGLTGFECRCGGLFCSLHRYSNEHNCTFDYKELGAQEIRKNNPLVVGEKIQKI